MSFISHRNWQNDMKKGRHDKEQREVPRKAKLSTSCNLLKLLKRSSFNMRNFKNICCQAPLPVHLRMSTHSASYEPQNSMNPFCPKATKAFRSQTGLFSCYSIEGLLQILPLNSQLNLLIIYLYIFLQPNTCLLFSTYSAGMLSEK